MNLETNEINLDKLCRICLKSCKSLFSLFKTQASSMLKYCGFLEVHEGDEFPDKICERCNEMLVQSFELKQLCVSSKTYVESLVNKNIETPSRSEHSTTNSTLDCETYELHKEKRSESELTEEISFLLQHCSECGACFSSEELLHEHVCSVDEDRSVLPNNEFVSNAQLFQSENDPQSIGEGESEFEDKKNLTYQCSQCNVQFAYEQDFSVHQSVHSGKGPICNVCNKLFRTMKILRRHIKTHMITKTHICKVCDKGFSESAALLKHTRRHHLRLPREKKYGCEDCGQRFTDQYYLNLHKRKHTGEKPLKCRICNKSFYDPRSYKVHMDVHKGTKPYLCSHCGKSFVQSAHLRQHLLVHTKEKPHICEVCNKCFTQSTSLRRHQKAHKIFTCSICLESFVSQKHLQEHKENHYNKNNTTGVKYIDDENVEPIR